MILVNNLSDVVYIRLDHTLTPVQLNHLSLFKNTEKIRVKFTELLDLCQI